MKNIQSRLSSPRLQLQVRQNNQPKTIPSNSIKTDRIVTCRKLFTNFHFSSSDERLNERDKVCLSYCELYYLVLSRDCINSSWENSPNNCNRRRLKLHQTSLVSVKLLLCSGLPNTNCELGKSFCTLLLLLP